MTAEAPAFTAGIYDMPEDAYHADPVPGGSLSVSGAKKLLPPSCPAKYAWEREHPEPKRHFELGTAAHRMVLGLGAEWALIDYPDYRTKAAQQAQREARDAGVTPILAPEYEQIQAMAAAIRTHPLASALLCREDVQPEQSFFWQDPEFGIWCRARLDALRPGSPPIAADYKSTRCADPRSFAKSAADYGYHQQEAWYADAVAAVLGTQPAFFFIAQEKEPPYLVTVCELADEDVAAGRAANRRAMEIYRDCQARCLWPGYQPDDGIALISLPAWARAREDIYS